MKLSERLHGTGAWADLAASARDLEADLDAANERAQLLAADRDRYRREATQAKAALEEARANANGIVSRLYDMDQAKMVGVRNDYAHLMAGMAVVHFFDLAYAQRIQEQREWNAEQIGWHDDAWRAHCDEALAIVTLVYEMREHVLRGRIARQRRELRMLNNAFARTEGKLSGMIWRHMDASREARTELRNIRALCADAGCTDPGDGSVARALCMVEELRQRGACPAVHAVPGPLDDTGPLATATLDGWKVGDACEFEVARSRREDCDTWGSGKIVGVNVADGLLIIEPDAPSPHLAAQAASGVRRHIPPSEPRDGGNRQMDESERTKAICERWGGLLGRLAQGPGASGPIAVHGEMADTEPCTECQEVTDAMRLDEVLAGTEDAQHFEGANREVERLRAMEARAERAERTLQRARALVTEARKKPTGIISREFMAAILNEGSDS